MRMMGVSIIVTFDETIDGTNQVIYDTEVAVDKNDTDMRNFIVQKYGSNVRDFIVQKTQFNLGLMTKISTSSDWQVYRDQTGTFDGEALGDGKFYFKDPFWISSDEFQGSIDCELRRVYGFGSDFMTDKEVAHEKVYKNPYFGGLWMASKADANFRLKEVADYTVEEWLENVFIAPCENSAHPNEFSFMDKRMPYSLSRMQVSMPRKEIMALKDDPHGCLKVMLDYYYGKSSKAR